MIIFGRGLIMYRYQRVVTRSSATVQDSSDYVKEQLAAKQAIYEAAQAKAARIESVGDIPDLESLELLSFIDEEGNIRNSGIVKGKTRASIFAIYDQANSLQYIGKSRDADQSLRTMLIRQPELAYSFRVYHIDKPSRALLDAVAEAWLANSGTATLDPTAWENPLDIKPLMTLEDRADFEAKKVRGKEDMALKAVARRYETEKLDILKARGLTEKISFDPKLKGQGLLDLKLNRAGSD
mmetsp:Transcript_7462/g.9482  ORF Transcript_7462/g.9482 Transcript_7462/m.9482 type:complete len:239 (+) Transcript_7462:3-719(+)